MAINCRKLSENHAKIQRRFRICLAINCENYHQKKKNDNLVVIFGLKYIYSYTFRMGTRRVQKDQRQYQPGPVQDVMPGGQYLNKLLLRLGRD